jgi:hypothetical protein
MAPVGEPVFGSRDELILVALMDAAEYRSDRTEDCDRCKITLRIPECISDVETCADHAMDKAMAQAYDAETARLTSASEDGNSLTGNAAGTCDADTRSLPAGRFGRVELPGYRENTGWITEETRFGMQMAVVRDFDGTEAAVVMLGPACRIVWLPTPLKHPGPRDPLGLAAGDEDDADDEENPF